MEEVPIEGGEIREGVIGYPRYINPLLPVTDAGRDLSNIVYSGMLKVTPSGELIPDLAESYSVSEDGLTYDVLLKENIYFHDGEKVTTKDIEYTIKKALDPVLKSPKSANWQGVGIEVIDDRNIRFTLKHAYGPFLENLTLGILPEHIWKGVDSEAFPFSQFNFEPIGSGPYEIDEVKRDKSGLPLYYHFVPFGKYALGKPYINHLYVYFYANEEKLNEAFANGDITNINSISPENVKNFENKKNVTIRKAPLPRIFGLFFNQNNSTLLANKEVRKALDVSINRTEIIDSVLYGYGAEIFGPLPASISDNKKDPLSNEERIEKARTILEKAGWKKDDNGKYHKSDKKEKLDLTFSISTSNVSELKATAYLLKDTWEKLGATVEVKIFDIADLNQNIIRQRKYDALLFGESIGRDLDLFAFWHSSERNDPGLNVSMYTNSTIDKILNQARTTRERVDRIKLYEKFEDEVDNDTPAVFLYSPDFIYIVDSKIKGINLDGLVNASDRFLGINSWYMDTEKVWKLFNKRQ